MKEAILVHAAALNLVGKKLSFVYNFGGWRRRIANTMVCRFGFRGGINALGFGSGERLQLFKKP
jgi:hypothetical protein